MKKFFFFAAAAAIAMTACTKTETTAVSEGNLIRFSNSFVDNVTKADVTSDNFTKFWAYGESADGKGTVFSNMPVTKSGAAWNNGELVYWTPSQDHFFAAYADGESTIADASLAFSRANSSLQFTQYTVGTNDLVAAVASKNPGDLETAPGAVQLTFKHMLSKVKFTFKTQASHDQVMEVTNLKVNAINKADGTIALSGSDQNITWNTAGTVTSGYYLYGETSVADFANEAATASTVEKYFIPQSNETLSVTFTVTWKISEAEGAESRTANFTGTLAYEAGENAWKPGMSYNYVSTINPEQVDPELANRVIKFEVVEVEDWAEDTNVDYTPSITPGA